MLTNISTGVIIISKQTLANGFKFKHDKNRLSEVCNSAAHNKFDKSISFEVLRLLIKNHFMTFPAHISHRAPRRHDV